MSEMIVDNLTKSYANKDVLRGVSFEVKKGQVYSLLGSNGAGKTTTINILSTLLHKDSGTVSVAGYDIEIEPNKVRHNISLTGQYSAIDDLLTGRENMQMVGALSRIPNDILHDRINDLLDRFSLRDVANARASVYSGGMKRKLDLAISLLSHPSIIFLDEPTTGLDPRSRQELWRIIRELSTSGTTILLTTQYLDEADNLADIVGVIDDGKIVAEGTASDLKRRVGGEYVEFTFENDSDIERAKTILINSTIIKNTQILSVPLQKPSADMRSALDTLAEASLEPMSINIRKPTLDDAFMKLTDTKVPVSKKEGA